MSADSEDASDPLEPTLGPEFKDMNGDVLIPRGQRLYVVRCSKRGQAFVPKSLFEVVSGFWDFVFTVLLDILRYIPPLMTRGWQVGVFWTANKEDPGKKHTLVLKEKIGAPDAAHARQEQLVELVRSGDFDQV